MQLFDNRSCGRSLMAQGLVSRNGGNRDGRLVEVALTEAGQTTAAALEQALGIEVVTVVTARSDAYPQIVWRAFALGAAFAALAVTLVDLAWGSTLTAVVAAVGHRVVAPRAPGR